MHLFPLSLPSSPLPSGDTGNLCQTGVTTDLATVSNGALEEEETVHIYIT